MALDEGQLCLEINGVTVVDFGRELRGHLHGRWRNPAGFIRDLAQRFRAKTVFASAPVTAAEAEERNYRCSVCGSDRRGEGAVLENGQEVPCACADPGWIATQRARGFFQVRSADLEGAGS